MMEFFKNLICLCTQFPVTAGIFGLGSVLIPYFFAYLDYQKKQKQLNEEIYELENQLN